MPNWCSTTYKCVSDRREDLESLNNLLIKLQDCKEPITPNGFGNMWLGCIVSEMGGDWKEIQCRGEVLDFRLEKDYLWVDTEVAWGEQTGFRRFLEDKYPGMKLYYREIEPGCEIYQTNDIDGSYFPEQYILDFETEDDGGYEYYDSLKEVINAVEDITGKDYIGIATSSGISDFLSAWNEEKEDEGYYCYLHEFNFIDD